MRKFFILFGHIMGVTLFCIKFAEGASCDDDFFEGTGFSLPLQWYEKPLSPPLFPDEESVGGHEGFSVVPVSLMEDFDPELTGIHPMFPKDDSLFHTPSRPRKVAKEKLPVLPLQSVQAYNPYQPISEERDEKPSNSSLSKKKRRGFYITEKIQNAIQNQLMAGASGKEWKSLTLDICLGFLLAQKLITEGHLLDEAFKKNVASSLDALKVFNAGEGDHLGVNKGL